MIEEDAYQVGHRAVTPRSASPWRFESIPLHQLLRYEKAMGYIIDDPRKFRISKSGYSIKTGWGDETRIVASYHNPFETPMDAKRFNQWLDDAQTMCDAYNALLASGMHCDNCGGSRDDHDHYVNHGNCPRASHSTAASHQESEGL